jgi:hypothetical protein
MGISAVLTALVLRSTGGLGGGWGGFTSMCLTGFLLDAALWMVGRGWLVYLGFAAAGVASNLVAMAVRGGVKKGGLDNLTQRPFEDWFTQAVFTYPFFGLVAGLACALLFFSLRSRSAVPQSSQEEAA